VNHLAVQQINCSPAPQQISTRPLLPVLLSPVMVFIGIPHVLRQALAALTVQGAVMLLQTADPVLLMVVCYSAVLCCCTCALSCCVAGMLPQGALLCLAAATVGLGEPSEAYLRQIVPPVLASFTDQDSRVRYYACEALYNIAKVRLQQQQQKMPGEYACMPGWCVLNPLYLCGLPRP